VRKSRLQQLQNYLDGTADPETAQRIEAELQDPDNAFARMLRGMREHLPGDDPCDVDFAHFFTEEDLGELPPMPGATAPTVESEASRAGTGALQPAGVIPGDGALPRDGRRGIRWLAYSGIAAAVLLGLGLLWAAWQRTRPGETLLVSLTPEARKERAGAPAVQVRLTDTGTYRVQADGAFNVVLRSPRRGYASLVLMTPRQTIVYPKSQESAIVVEPWVEQVSPPLPLQEETVVLIVITQSPAASVVRAFFDSAGFPPRDLPAHLDALKDTLWKQGYTWAALGQITVEPDPKP
jgi:hypothetical protein